MLFAPATPLHIAFLDIAKAYDSVEIWAMIDTLTAYGLHKNDIEILRDMITGNKTKLDTAHGPTEDVHIEAGVRQGDIISPTLYLLFLNPLLKWLEADKSGIQDRKLHIPRESLRRQHGSDRRLEKGNYTSNEEGQPIHDT